MATQGTKVGLDRKFADSLCSCEDLCSWNQGMLGWISTKVRACDKSVSASEGRVMILQMDGFSHMGEAASALDYPKSSRR